MKSNLNITEWFIVLWALSAVLYCLFAALFLPRELTVSATLFRTAKLYPIVPLLLGFFMGLLMGHIFWTD